MYWFLSNKINFVLHQYKHPTVVLLLPLTIGTVLPACILYWPTEWPAKHHNTKLCIKLPLNDTLLVSLLIPLVLTIEISDSSDSMSFAVDLHLIWLHHFLYGLTNITQPHINTSFSDPWTHYSTANLADHWNWPVCVASLTAASNGSNWGLNATVNAQSMIRPFTCTQIVLL